MSFDHIKRPVDSVQGDDKINAECLAMRHTKRTQGRILIIDDEPSSIAILAELLKNGGYQVRAARGKDQALKSLQIEQVDLILLDICMPSVSGFELCQRLKSDPATASIPVIFLSAQNDKSDKIKGLELGAVDYITKPFDPDETVARVARQLRLKSEYKRVSSAAEYRKTGLEKDTRQQICRLVADYFDKQKPFLAADLSASAIAANIGVTQHNLSEAINLEFQQNLSHFINRYRIDYFCENYMQNPESSVLNLAVQSGFRSKSAFNHWFKVFKQTTPKKFLQTALGQRHR